MSLGYGYTGLEKHATMMNMPKPMTINSCNKIVDKISCVAKAVAFDSMSDAAKEIHTLKGIPEHDTETIVDTGVISYGDDNIELQTSAVSNQAIENFVNNLDIGDIHSINGGISQTVTALVTMVADLKFKTMRDGLIPITL